MVKSLWNIATECLMTILLKTFGDLLLYYGSHLLDKLRIMALSDVAERLQYLHCTDLGHSDIKPQSKFSLIMLVTSIYKHGSQFSAGSPQTTNDTRVFSTRVD